MVESVLVYMRRDRPVLIPGSRPRATGEREICSAPGNPLWMLERTAQWVFRGHLGVVGLERQQVGEDFISTVLLMPFGKIPIQFFSGSISCFFQPKIVCLPDNPDKLTVSWF